MVLPSANNRISLGDIEEEFGQNNKRSIGDYRKRADDKLYPESFTGGLSFSSLDSGIPTISNLDDTTTPIKFSQFNGKKLNMVIDFYTGGTESRKNAKTRYDADKVTMIGGYASKPSSHGGKKAVIYVNKTIHSDQNVNHRNVALNTGLFPDDSFSIDLTIHVGTNGKIIGSGGEGGRGGDNGNQDGSVGRDGSSALGLLTAASIVNNGTIQTGFGGGGGGAGFGETRSTGKKSSRFYTAPGGGGGGGAGIPAGLGGASGSAGDANASAGPPATAWM